MAEETTIFQSPSDRKSYKYLRLSNGVSVLLIQDPAVAEALAAAEASAGHGPDGQQDTGATRGEDGGSSGSSGSEDASLSTGSSDSGSGEEGDADASSDAQSSDEIGDGENARAEAGEQKGKGGSSSCRAGSTGKLAGVKKAAAALAVRVGSFSDPPNLPGLSHYLEHMLFMGSSKFPDENEYDSYLSKHGGSSNAFTELEYTNYHFEVGPESLHGALDRFAQFFIAPLFQADALEREVQAVDSEFSGVLQSDHSRLAQLMCHTSKPGHVYNKFSWGNLVSLWERPRANGIDVRQSIIDYYSREYCPSRMSLAVLGGQPLRQLEAWVRELFEAVPAARQQPPPSFSSQGMPFEGRVLYAAPAVKEHHEVTVTFQLPCLRSQYATKPDHYISHLVGHEGPGSLLSALKARGWALELCAGVDDDGYSANSAAYLFSVSITLTEAGLAAGPGAGLAPVALLFQYLRMMEDAGPQSWVWDELKGIADMRFRFLEEEDSCDLVTRLASSMGWVAPEHLLVADYLHTQWQPDQVAELLHRMQPTSTYRIDLLTNSYQDTKQLLQQLQADTESWLSGSTVQVFTEPWFNMEALSILLPDSVTAGWAQAEIAADLALPPQNPYIPSDFVLRAPGGAAAAADTVKSSTSVSGGGAAEASVEPWMLVGGAAALPQLLAQPPLMLVDEPGLRLWHKLCVAYEQPRVCAYFRLASPAAGASPAAAVLGALWLRLAEEALTEDAYLADVAGLHWSSSPEGAAGFEVRMDGFSHKLGLLAAKVYSTLAGGKVCVQAFSRVREQLLRRYRNALLQPAKAAAALRLQFLCGGPHWSADQMAAALECITDAEQVQSFAHEFLSCCHLECLLVGNITASEAQAMAASLRTTLNQSSSSSHGSTVQLVSAADRRQEQCVVLPAGVALLHKASARNPQEENCCVEAYIQIGLAQDLHLRVCTDLVDQLLHEPLYDSLRTKQQLGYTVSSGARLTHGVCGFCVVVVSAAFGPEVVEARIEDALQEQLDRLQAMSADEFERHKAALASNKLQKDTTLGQEGDRLWEQVFSTRYEFLSREQEAALLQQISLAELQQFYATYLAPSSLQRRKLVVAVAPARQTNTPAQQQQLEQQQQVSHVQHQHGMATAHELGGRQQQQQQHIVGAGVVHAGQPHQQDGRKSTVGNDAATGLKPPSPRVRAKRPKLEQQQQLQHAAGDDSSAASAAPVELVPDPDSFKQGRDRFAVYCTVKPQVARTTKQLQY